MDGSGLALAVLQDGKVAFIRPYGLRDVEADLNVTVDTQFQLMSVVRHGPAVCSAYPRQTALTVCGREPLPWLIAFVISAANLWRSPMSTDGYRKRSGQTPGRAVSSRTMPVTTSIPATAVPGAGPMFSI